MQTEARQEHQWLQQLVGEWTYESDGPAEPGKSEAKLNGTESVRSLGGLWIVAEGHGEMPGGEPGTTVMTLGFDPRKERYVGTWLGSMMPNLWVYDGALSADGNDLALDSEGPHMEIEGKTALYRDVVTLSGPDQRTLTSYMQGDDGEWQQIMKVHYRRTA